MPANLTPQYKSAEAVFKAAVTREEKMAGLEEMLRIIPKHKGTEHLQADLRSRLSKLRQDTQKKGPSRGGPSHKILKEGAGQVTLVGAPNAGKSSLVAALSRAKPDVAAYPITTMKATPGMMPYEDVAFQLVDLPLCHEHVEPWVYDIIRASDLVWLVVSVQAPIMGLELVEELISTKAIGLYPAGAAAPEDTRPGWSYKKAVLVVTGMDLPGAQGDLEALEELVELPWPRVAVSTIGEESMAALGPATFEALEIMRIYTKEPRKEPDMSRPFTLKRGSTVEDLAKAIHKEIAQGIKFARVWGPSVHDGQSVHEHHVLEEGDVVELHV